MFDRTFMPAIQPARLRLQATRLAELYDQPQAFVRALHGLLELYSDRTHRPGQSGKPPPLAAAYNVPSPVLRQLLRELHPRVSQDREQTLALSRLLWAEPYFESQVLAATLLGLAPADPAEPILEQLNRWLAALPEERILSVLLDEGMLRIRKDNPQKLLALAKDWLSDPQVYPKQNALRLLRPLAMETEADHLPAIFLLITPYLRRAPLPLRADLISLLTAAARSSPQETAFVLRQNLEAPDNPDTAWLIRQVVDEFPPDLQDSLRTSMRR